jgi:hypothetical protein
LPPKAEKYRFNPNTNPNGRGEILMDLPESNIQGQAADYRDGDLWATAYDINYPLVIDPEYQFEATMIREQAAFPTNILVDTRTMTIVEIIAGSPETAFWRKYDDVLAGTWQQ